MLCSRVVSVLSELGILSSSAKLPEDLLSKRVSLLTSDSRSVSAGALFVAVAGEKVDGHSWLDTAIESGALLLIGEKDPKGDLSVPYLQVTSSRLALGVLASEFYGHPSRDMKVIGVTGTSGKTTSTYLIESILKAHGERVGVVGTVNFRFESEVIPSTHTTPGPVELQRLLQQMKDRGCTALVMEVSSHALKQHRTMGLVFDAMVFTNLSPEHLDYHPDMQDYFDSKALLFTQYAEFSVQAGKHPVVVVTVDQDWGEKLVQSVEELPYTKTGQVKLVRVKTEASAQDSVQWSGEKLQMSLGGLQGPLSESLQINSPLIGRFNVSNILGAVGVASGLGIPNDVIARGLQSLVGVPGRMERVIVPIGGTPPPRMPHVWVDYAHKPDALEKVLRTLQRLRDEVSPGGKLITVFGCGGDRDRQKRPKMGAIAAELSDWVWVTSDNPRTESPVAILAEVVSGISSQMKHKCKVIEDRASAIHDAIHCADAGDLVLIAGKGHEDYQIILDPSDFTRSRTMKIHFDDREVAREALLKVKPQC